MKNIFKKIFKKQSLPQEDRSIPLNAFGSKKDPKDFLKEPETIATFRLSNGANDFGAKTAVKIFNSHKVKVKNQWINQFTSVNSGYATANLSYFNFQVINYWESMILTQDPLINKVLNILTNSIFSKGGNLVKDGLNSDFIANVERKANQIKYLDVFGQSVKTAKGQGGALLYLDFGNIEDLTQPLDLKNVDCRKFKGFRLVEPINTAGIQVDTVNVASPSYMKPSLWYVVGLGAVHESRLLYFAFNEPPKMLKPMVMYYGTPLTNLIKQNVANANLVSQGVAELMGRFRRVVLKTNRSNWTGNNASMFRSRLEAMAECEDNFRVWAIDSEEEIIQIQTTLAGLAENEAFSYQIISANTNVPFTLLMGKSADGMNATGEGDMKNFFEGVGNDQQLIKPNLLAGYGIIAGLVGDGKFVEFDDYIFNPLEVLNEKERTEVFKNKVEIAQILTDSLGVSSVNVLDWLKQDKSLKISNLEIDTTPPVDIDDYGDDNDKMK